MKTKTWILLLVTASLTLVPARSSGWEGPLEAARSAAARGDAETALAEIRLAVDHARGSNLEVARACTEIANWNGDYDLAVDCWEQILAHPDLDAEGARKASLGRARSVSWSGEGDKAVTYFRRHVREYPADAPARLELARAETWRGNVPAARDVLDDYRTDFGVDDAYRRELAFVLADVRPRASLQLLAELLERQPSDNFLRGVEPVALARDGRPADALDSLDRLRQAAPDAERTGDVARLVETPLRSRVTPLFEVYDDADSLRRDRAGLDAKLALRPGVGLTAGLWNGRLEADAGTGLEASGGRPLHTRTGRIGVEARLGPSLQLDARVGESDIEERTLSGRDDLVVYRVGVDLALGDDVDLRLRHGRDFFDISPRALDLGIDAVDTDLQAVARPGRRTVVEAWASSTDLSDGNDRLDLILTPRRIVVRRQDWNLDLGLRGRWLSFDRQDLGHGYYAPEDYRRYDVVAYGYWKIAENHGLSFLGAIGPFKDETMEGYETAFDLSFELTLGIYQDWVVRAHGAYTNNDRVASGAFDALTGRISLGRRF